MIGYTGLTKNYDLILQLLRQHNNSIPMRSHRSQLHQSVGIYTILDLARPGLARRTWNTTLMRMIKRGLIRHSWELTEAGRNAVLTRGYSDYIRRILLSIGGRFDVEDNKSFTKYLLSIGLHRSTITTCCAHMLDRKYLVDHITMTEVGQEYLKVLDAIRDAAAIAPIKQIEVPKEPPPRKPKPKAVAKPKLENRDHLSPEVLAKNRLW